MRVICSLRRPFTTVARRMSATQTHYQVPPVPNGVHCLEVNKNAGRGPTVVLLHGQSFEAQTWEEIGTLHVLGERGLRAVAADLPGHGSTGGHVLASASERGQFMHALLQQLAPQPPVVLVSPSMSGAYATALLSSHTQDVAAWLPIAAVGLRQWAQAGLPPGEQRSKLAVLAVYGEHDPMRSDFAALEDAFPRAQFLLIKDAGHACYLEQPGQWHTELLRFLENEMM